ncbi:MAG: hypothetical protein NUW21_12645, partial [Elusimicrobia bacterium]|nr:hypothetical protein [Elusimicrobiota bacterium]
MDVLLRLRVLIWVLVISLWGVMVYQYLGEEEAEIAKMKRIEPYVTAQRLPLAPPSDEGAISATIPPEAATNAPAAVPPAALGVNPPPGAGLPVIPSSDYVGPAPSSGRRSEPGPVAAAPAAPGRRR